jgi:hypothetical protein
MGLFVAGCCAGDGSWMEYVTPTMHGGRSCLCTNLTEVYNMRGARRTNGSDMRGKWGREREGGPSTMGRTELGGPLQLSPAGRRHGGARGKRRASPGKDNEPTTGLVDDRRRLPCPFLPSTGRLVIRIQTTTCFLVHWRPIPSLRASGRSLGSTYIRRGKKRKNHTSYAPIYALG